MIPPTTAQVGAVPADSQDMKSADVALAQEQARRMAARRAAATSRDCGTCGAPMGLPRPQTLVTRRFTEVVRHLYLCGECRAWESEVVADAS